MNQPSNLAGSVIKSGLIVGVFDAIAASVYSFVLSGATPDSVFRYVASGVFGRDAISGGLSIAILGLLFHFIIATGWTALFYLVYPKINFVSERKYISGIGYGIFIWLMMNFVIAPLSNVPARPFHFSMKTLTMIAIHMFIIGIPISYLADKYYSRVVK